MNHSELASANKEFTLASWVAQNQWKPLTMTKAQGVYFWNADGKKFIDWSSQLMNVNIGHGNKYVNEAIKSEVDKLSFAYPGIGTEARASIGKKLNEITPNHITKSFFTNGGADAVENAIKMARLASGKNKIMTRYRSYHGGTFGAMTAGGDPRRLANEPGIPGIIRMHDPYCYQSPIYRGKTQEEGDQILIDQIHDTILFEGPNTIAAMLLEGYSGSSGIMQGSEVYWNGIQDLCDKYSILLIIDEVMSGFGRTGKWFGFQHYPNLKPDIIVMAKGLTSGYVQLGAVSVSDKISSYFDTNPLWGGLTYSAHHLGCAAAAANIEVYQNDNLIEHAAKMGKVLESELKDLAEKHPCVGDIRGEGLHFVIELVENKKTRKQMSPFNSPPTEPMQKVAKHLLENGLSTFVRWSWIFCNPPLIISEDQIQEGIDIIDGALTEADKFVK